mmetsp:Transcript_20208/g.44112  ORF Transcript_20208/g.44112 Transcript_20208/m.44112 type:complete len:115 (+) Transcript_20208:132-476(+)
MAVPTSQSLAGIVALIALGLVYTGMMVTGRILKNEHWPFYRLAAGGSLLTALALTCSAALKRYLCHRVAWRFGWCCEVSPALGASYVRLWQQEPVVLREMCLHSTASTPSWELS